MSSPIELRPDGFGIMFGCISVQLVSLMVMDGIVGRDGQSGGHHQAACFVGKD